MFPRPIADPTAAKMKPVWLPQVSLELKEGFSIGPDFTIIGHGFLTLNHFSARKDSEARILPVGHMGFSELPRRHRVGPSP